MPFGFHVVLDVANNVEDVIMDANPNANNPNPPNAPANPNIMDPNDPMNNTLVSMANTPAMLGAFTTNATLTELENIEDPNARENALINARNVHSYSESDASIAMSREVGIQ